MHITHPAVPFQGIDPQDVFFVSNERQIQMGMGFVVLSMQQTLYPECPLHLYLYIDAQPSARNLLLGALLGRAEQKRAQFPHLRGRIYTQLSANHWDLMNFYNRNGFQNTDAQEEYVFDWPAKDPGAPMGIAFASVPLQTLPERQAFLQRLNAQRLTPIDMDYLTLQMNQPYFLALGYYRGGQALCECLITGNTPEQVALVEIYTSLDHRKRGLAKSLLVQAGAILTQREVTQGLCHVYSRNKAQMGLMHSLEGQRKRIISILPAIEIK